MRTLLMASAILTTIAGAASAADAVVYEQVPESSAYNWSGFYVGGALGYSWLKGEDLDYGDGSASDGGFSGALYAGYNYQYNNIVLGVEGDLKIADTEVFDGDYLLPLESKLAGSVRGRLGYAIGEFMPYLTGGLAIGGFDIDHDGDGSDIASETLTGYVVGGGVEWGATQNIVVRAEYLFSDYGSHDFEFSGSDFHEVDVQTQDFRLGIAYKF